MGSNNHGTFAETIVYFDEVFCIYCGILQSTPCVYHSVYTRWIIVMIEYHVKSHDITEMSPRSDILHCYW